MIRRIIHLLVAHWRGALPLLPTLVVTVLGLRLGLSWLSGLRPEGTAPGIGIGLSLLSLMVLIWQITGALRATRQQARDLSSSLSAYMACVVAVSLFLTTEMDALSRQNPVALAPASAPLPLPVTDGIAVLTGTLDWPLYARLRVTLDQHPEITGLSLRSNGGLVPVGRAMGLVAAQRRLATRADGLCASACTLVFIAGSRRILGEGGGLGFHGYAMHRTDPLQSAGEEEARDMALFRRRGVAPWFIERAFSEPHETLWRPSPEVLRQAGVVTE